MHFYFLGLDVHKQVMVYCWKKVDWTIGVPWRDQTGRNLIGNGASAVRN